MKDKYSNCSDEFSLAKINLKCDYFHTKITSHGLGGYLML